MFNLRQRSIIRFLLLAGVSGFLTGCGITLSPVKRAPVSIAPLETSVPSDSQILLVRFESTLGGTPLTETVWDNVSGAFADANESKQIGFTQDYAKLAPAAAAGGPVGGAVVGTQPDYTRIVIPFGRIFHGVLQSGLQKAFPNSLTCLDDACELEKLQSPALENIVKLKVSEFQVWEAPLNHLNMRALLECKVYQAGVTNPPSLAFEVRQEATNQSIGSVMTTSSGFIKGMNKLSNRFAAGLSEEILKDLQTKLRK